MKIESWQSLVHVCRRWRCLVFGSSRYLNLRLCCIPSTTPGTCSRQPLDIWPALPLFILGDLSRTSNYNVTLDLKHSDRICQIKLYSRSLIERFEIPWTALQVPFPELTFLYLSNRNSESVLPDPFLGGFAPRLRSLYMIGVPFRGIPKLLLSLTHLVHLHLEDIPYCGYISPEAIVTCLSMLTSLESLQLELKYCYPDKESQHYPPPIRSILPTLLSFLFGGVNEYLEDLVSRIDAPRLHRLSITFFEHIRFDTPELNQFITRTPIFGTYDEAFLILEDPNSLVRLQSHHEPSDRGMVEVNIRPPWFNPGISSMARICTSGSLLRLLLTVESLYIHENLYSTSFMKDDIEDALWLDLLLAFTAVKYLYLTKLCALCIGPILQKGPTVLPTLQSIFLEGFQPSKPVHDGIRRFISARQLIDRPISISAWESDSLHNTV